MRGAFLALCLFALFKAIEPDGDPGWPPWDKAVHFGAFYVLSIAGAVILPRTALLRLAIGLVLFGGAIELIQALPVVGRDAEWGDWAADICGVVAALSPALLPRIRDWLRRFL